MERSLVKRVMSWQKKLNLAAESGKKGNYRQAVKLLCEIISETDAPPEAWLLLGRSLHALREYARALAAFNDYIYQRPEAAEGYFFAGRTCLALGMPYKAVPFLRKALEKNPGESSDLKSADFQSKTRALLGTAYLKSKHSQLAVQTLEEAVEEAPADKRIYRAYLNSLLVRGVRLCGTEDYELALQMFRFVLENGEEAGMADNPFLRLELGRAARETGNLEEALEHYTAALKLSGNSEKNARRANEAGGAGNEIDGDRRIRWSRASILMALGKTEEARKEIDRIRTRDRGIPELPWNSELVDLFMIRSFLESGEWRRAVASCREWLRTREDKPIIHVLCAEALRNMHNYEAAHNHLLRALETESGEPEFWYADILVSWEAKDYKSLKKALRSLKSLGGDPDVIKRFSILLEARTSEDTKGIITLLQNAVRSLGPEPELMYSLAEAYLKAGLLEEAQHWYRKTITLKKDHENAWLGEIAALEALVAEDDEDPLLAKRQPTENRSAELASLYKAYLKQWPDNSVIRREWALFLIKTCEYAEAATELEKLLAWEPSNPSLRRVLAYAYRKTGRYREAAVFLKSLLKEKPRDVGLLVEYSGCLERTGAAAYAVAVLEKARELFQNSSGKKENCRSVENPRKDGPAELSLALGVLLFRQGNVEKAFECLKEAAALAPNDYRPYEWMAIIARKNGDPQGGRYGSAYYEKEALKRNKFRK